MSYRAMFVVAGVVLVSACEGVESPEEAARWADHDAGLERVSATAAAACVNTDSSYTAMKGDKTCVSGYTYAAPEKDGSCPAGYSAGTASSSQLCDIAESLIGDPGECPDNCVDGGVSGASPKESQTSCTVEKYRECSARPADKTGVREAKGYQQF